MSRVIPSHPIGTLGWQGMLGPMTLEGDGVGMSRAVPSGVGTPWEYSRPIGLSMAMLDIEGCPAFILLMEE